MRPLTTSIHLSYAQLLSFTLNHAFYTNGLCPDIAIVPTEVCKKTLRANHWEFFQVPQGGKIFSKNGPANVWTAQGKSASLEFYLISKSNDFQAVTAFPMPQQPIFGLPVYNYAWENGSWTANSGQPTNAEVPNGIKGIIKLDDAFHPDSALEISLDFDTPNVVYTYYIVTGNSYTDDIQIAENNTVISTTGASNEQDLAKITQRYPNQKIWPLEVVKQLKRKYPNWYLVNEDGSSGWVPIADLPALSKPKINAAPHIILDYSALLK